MLGFNIGTLTQGDVGKSRADRVAARAGQGAGRRAAGQFSGDAEGAVISVDIPGMSSVNLGVNQVALGNDLQNQAAEYRIDYAITTLGGARAQIGAQTVSLQETANGGNIASVNTQAAESAIRDLDVGRRGDHLHPRSDPEPVPDPARRRRGTPVAKRRDARLDCRSSTS